MTIANNLLQIKNKLPDGVTLVAVSKTKPKSAIMEAYDCGHRIFGENKIQEMTQKWEALPKDIQWHMIGHVQTNKVKYMAPYVNLIHGVDSLKLIKEIDKQAKKNNRIINCLLQVHIATESTKFGLLPGEVEAIFENSLAYESVRVVGLMGMASLTTDEQQVLNEFKGLNALFEKLKQKNKEFQILSMGMSGDYPIAIQMGSTMIRVGSNIFGQRNY